MIAEHPDFYLPNLATFQNDNGFLGSFHGLRFRVKPNLGKDGSQPALHALVWHGLLCLELSQVVAEQSFPLTEEGHAQVLVWLDDQYQKLQEAGSATNS